MDGLPRRAWFDLAWGFLLRFLGFPLFGAGGGRDALMHQHLAELGGDFSYLAPSRGNVTGLLLGRLAGAAC